MRQLRLCAFVLVLTAVVSEPLRAACTDSSQCGQGFRCCACQCIVGFCNPVFECPPRDFAPPSAEGETLSANGAAVAAPELRLDDLLQSLATESCTAPAGT